ncbi:MAG: MarC family protein [Elusimicrobiales bacterium]|jgi:multiple antibiotic resistance protein|nr:MarC family protein [Elusimicrobiales bacterium]NLH38551.1 MarC family protein [Elusimicrobiota bacterium]
MLEFISKAFLTFLTLFPILNPPAMSPIFNELTYELGQKRQNRVAYMVAKYSFYLLTSSLIIGSWILGIFGISVPVIKIAGGILLFNTAWKMLNDQPKISEEERRECMRIDEKTAFYPMTLPLTAGPGSISITISLSPIKPAFDIRTLNEIASIIAGIFLASASIYIFYRYSSAIIKKLDYSKQQIISKLSAFILFAIAIEITLDGLKLVF